MSQPVSLIIGAGNIGKGPIMYFLSKNHHRIILSSRTYDTVAYLSESGYTIHAKDKNGVHEVGIKDFEHAAFSSETFNEIVSIADSIFVCVYETVYHDIATALTKGLLRRQDTHSVVPLNIVLCSNNLKCVSLFKRELAKAVGDTFKFDSLGITHALISIGSKPVLSNPYDVEINLINYAFEVDAKHLKNDLNLDGISYVENIEMCYYRKVYFVNSVLTYMGLKGLSLGYQTLNECIHDLGIRELVVDYHEKLSVAFSQEYEVNQDSLVTFSKQVQEKLFTESSEALERLVKNVNAQLMSKDRILGPFELLSKHAMYSQLSYELVALPFINQQDVKDNFVSYLVQYYNLNCDNTNAKHDLEQHYHASF